MLKSLKHVARAVATASGSKKYGFYIPYKHASSIKDSITPYAAIETIFEQSQPAMLAVLNTIQDHSAALADACNGRLNGHWNGAYFGLLDTAAAYAIIKTSGATRIVEIGSGSSTHVMCAACEALEPEPEIVCVDPAPRSAIKGLNVSWDRSVLSEDHIEKFASLRRGDIAFFDSSYVLFEGTDVDIIQNRILPVLQPGVLVHIHDVFLPDPYPVPWRPRAYTEQTGLGGWICGGAYEIVFSSHFAATRMQTATEKALADVADRQSHGGGSIWLRRR